MKQFNEKVTHIGVRVVYLLVAWVVLLWLVLDWMQL
jgi:hypothetical protein